MSIIKRIYKLSLRPLLFCFLLIAGIDVSYSQTLKEQIVTDSVTVREAPKARARRNRINQFGANDSIQNRLLQSGTDSLSGIVIDTIQTLLTDTIAPLSVDSLQKMANKTALIIDSLERANQATLKELEKPIELATEVKDSIKTTIAVAPPHPTTPRKVWLPNSTKATWLAVVFPGGGQIYNRKFWKLPIIYGGFAGCAYALTWNGKMYNDYSQAYLDIMDDDPNTNSFLDLLPNRLSNYSETQLKEIIRKRKDMFRRYRDLSIFAVIGVYLISIVDAYVDAELSNFDITPDLSMRIEPTIFSDKQGSRSHSVGVQCSFRF